MQVSGAAIGERTRVTFLGGNLEYVSKAWKNVATF